MRYFWSFSIVFDHANVCASMRLLVEIHNIRGWLHRSFITLVTISFVGMSWAWAQTHTRLCRAVVLNLLCFWSSFRIDSKMLSRQHGKNRMAHPLPPTHIGFANYVMSYELCQAKVQICCVFWPAFGCCAHPKAGLNTFLRSFSTFFCSFQTFFSDVVT